MLGSVAAIGHVLVFVRQPWLIGPGLSWAVTAVYGGCMIHLTTGLVADDKFLSSWRRPLVWAVAAAFVGWWAGLGLELFIGVQHGGLAGALVGLGAGVGAPHGKAGEGAMVAAAGAGMLFVVAILQRLDMVDSTRHIALMTGMLACAGLALLLYGVVRWTQPQWQNRAAGVPLFTGWFASWMTVLALVYAVALM